MKKILLVTTEESAAACQGAIAKLKARTSARVELHTPAEKDGGARWGKMLSLGGQVVMASSWALVLPCGDVLEIIGAGADFEKAVKNAGR